MPPGKSGKAVLSSSKALVSTGPKGVFAKNPVRRGANEALPTTSRALVLRNGKHGARGTGELMLASKISGREKLDLLAEDMVERATKAVASPFKLEKCLQIAESQLDGYLDEIAGLEDPETFSTKILNEFKARTLHAKSGVDHVSNNALLVGTVIHNAYMLASAWKLVSEFLGELESAGLDDAKIKHQLKDDAAIRSRYLALNDLVDILVNLSQQKFAVLATTTSHYAPYFKVLENSEPGDPEMVFDWVKLRDACKSFIDSIIIELCFPREPYPKFVLYQILHDAIEEAPKEAQRFPQALWDAVGDLSVTVELRELLERPLLGPDGRKPSELPRELPAEYDLWLDAQILSDKASSHVQNYKDSIYPLSKTRSRQVLDKMWKCVNLNYKSVCGKDIETLWRLEDRHRSPQWHSFFFPGAGGSSSDPSRKRTKPKKLLAITPGPAKGGHYDSMPELERVSSAEASEHELDYDSMPGLQSVSETDESSDDSSGDDDDPGERSKRDSASEYDEDYEEALRDLGREAMDLAHDIPGFFDHSIPIPPNAFAEEEKGNPFLKLLGSLRGRMFSSSPKLKTPRTATRPGVSRAPQATQPIKSTPGPVTAKAPAAEARPSQQKVTIEEVEDEEHVPRAPKKKKHKKKKKAPVEMREPGASQDPPAVPVPPPVAAPKTSDSRPLPPSPSQPARKPSHPVPPPSQPAQKPSHHAPPPSQPTQKTPVAPARAPSMNASTVTLPQIHQTTAESARKYLQAEHAESQKQKVKSRPDPSATSPAVEKREKKGFFSRFTKDKPSLDEKEMKQAKCSWFSKLTKKTNGYMRQLLRTSDEDAKGLAPMKWEHFLKIMVEMGFSIDPSTAGSSVRFDPPDRRDKSITFHKPHPDSTIPPIKLREWGKRLKRYYGWTEEDFLKHAV